MTMLRRSAPIMILSFESSNSDMVTKRLARLAASKAASLTRFMRSAPENPGVPRATVFKSTSGARGTLRTCTLRMRSRPTISGFAMTIWRSKRPGRRSAGSSTSGRFVAAIMMMLSLGSKPSISTRSWFKVCSRSSLPPPRPAPRRLPTASISSMKTMQGEFFLACSNMSRTGIVTPLRACGPAGGSVAKGMKKFSYRGYRFPPEIIQQAIWLYLRFTLSLRDVEDLLAERGIMVSYETVRRWVNHFGPMIAADLRKRRPKPHTTWHLDEVYLKIAGRMVYLWRAVDAEGEVLDVLVQSRRNKRAALKLMRKLLRSMALSQTSSS